MVFIALFVLLMKGTTFILIQDQYIEQSTKAKNQNGNIDSSAEPYVSWHRSPALKVKDTKSNFYI
jgi:hypothetical protein